jgi:kanosamine 6-kinase
VSIGQMGIDVGGTKVALRVEGAGRSEEASFRWRPSVSPDEDLTDLAQAVSEMRHHWAGPVSAVGVAMPATLGVDGRVATWPGRPSWSGLDVKGAFQELFPGATVTYADDGDLAALAEARHAGVADVVYIGVGTGIGGGIVLGGKLCPGPERGSCEVGHLIVDRSGPQCDCGRNGCVQAMASGPATLRRAAARRGRDVDFGELRAGWLAREAWAAEVISESCAAVATAIVGLSELVHPTIAVVGGGFADGMPGFVTTVGEHVRELTRPGVGPVPVQAAGLGGLSSLRGAILLAAQS